MQIHITLGCTLRTSTGCTRVLIVVHAILLTSRFVAYTLGLLVFPKYTVLSSYTSRTINSKICLLSRFRSGPWLYIPSCRTPHLHTLFCEWEVSSLIATQITKTTTSLFGIYYIYHSIDDLQKEVTSLQPSRQTILKS